VTSGSVASSPDVEPELDRRSAGTYFPAMDGYRAVAALAVLLAHVALLSGIVRTNTAFGPYLARADVGVSVFFLLSGFLLYRPFVAARLARRPSGSLGGYVRRRALRIIPAYWFALTIVAFVLKAPGFESPHSIPAHYLLLHPYDVDQVTGGPIQQSWTLATEVAFYVFLPVWAWLLARRDRTPSRQIRVEVIGLVGHTPGSITLAYRGAGPTHLFTGDSLFPGGPGRTTNPRDFASLMEDLETKIFGRFDDDTVVHPGHGDDTTLGAERPHLAEWRARGW